MRDWAEDGHLVIGNARGPELLDLPGNPAPLVPLVGGGVDRHLLPRGGIGEEALGFALGVVGDDRIGRRQDIAQRPVVLLQLHHLRVRVIVLELQDVADVGAAPGIDGLVVVAHHHDVSAEPRQKRRDGVLGPVRVLVLIHQHVGEAALIGRQHLGEALQQQIGVQQHAVEIEGVGGLQALLHAGVHPCHGLVEGVGGHLFQVLGHHQAVFRLGDGKRDGLRVVLLGIQVQLLHEALHQALHVVLVVDGELPRAAHVFGVGPQDAPAHAVEGGHPHAAGVRPHQGIEALPHLVGRLVGEGDGKDLPGVHAQILHQVGDTVGEHPGLAGTGTGQHQQGAFGAEYRFALGRVQR